MRLATNDNKWARKLLAALELRRHLLDRIIPLLQVKLGGGAHAGRKLGLIGDQVEINPNLYPCAHSDAGIQYRDGERSSSVKVLVRDRSNIDRAGPGDT